MTRATPPAMPPAMAAWQRKCCLLVAIGMQVRGTVRWPQHQTCAHTGWYAVCPAASCHEHSCHGWTGQVRTATQTCAPYDSGVRATVEPAGTRCSRSPRRARAQARHRVGALLERAPALPLSTAAGELQRLRGPHRTAGRLQERTALVSHTRHTQRS